MADAGRWTGGRDVRTAAVGGEATGVAKLDRSLMPVMRVPMERGERSGRVGEQALPEEIPLPQTLRG